MNWFININDCCGCTACSQICPRQCIKMTRNKEGFFEPVLEVERCIDCGLCKKVCPVLNKQQKNDFPRAYVCQNISNDILIKSSSGGFFYSLADYVINKKGVVFGAAFDDDFNVRHLCVKSINDIHKLLGSKYVASNLHNTFQEVKSLLLENTLVLFSGTPCQVLGLLNFLGKKFENLLTVDIMCHGIPSPKVWDLYKKEIAKNEVITNITFRCKDFGWSRYALRIESSNKVLIHEPNDINSYMRGFIAGLFLRNSCHNCPARNFVSGSDFMIGDFWEARNEENRNKYDDKGFSLVLNLSKRAHSIFSKLQNIQVSEYPFF